MAKPIALLQGNGPPDVKTLADLVRDLHPTTKFTIAIWEEEICNVSEAKQDTIKIEDFDQRTLEMCTAALFGVHKSSKRTH